MGLVPFLTSHPAHQLSDVLYWIIQWDLKSKICTKRSYDGVLRYHYSITLIRHDPEDL